MTATKEETISTGSFDIKLDTTGMLPIVAEVTMVAATDQGPDNPLSVTVNSLRTYSQVHSHLFFNIKLMSKKLNHIKPPWKVWFNSTMSVAELNTAFQHTIQISVNRTPASKLTGNVVSPMGHLVHLLYL